MTHQIPTDSIAQVEQDFVESWNLLQRLQKHPKHAELNALISRQQGKVERLAGYLALRCGHSGQSLATLTGAGQKVGDATLHKMTIQEYLKHYRGFPAWFQKGDDFHLISQAAEHTPRFYQDSTAIMSHVEYWRAYDGQFCITLATDIALVDLGGTAQR